MERLLIILSVLLLASCGGGSDPAPVNGGGNSGGGTTNTPPSFSSATSFSFDENVAVDFTLTVTDPDSSTVTITDDANGDGALFILDANTGRITANTSNGAFDFENPQDVNNDNVYEQDITLSDGTNTVTQTITVTITDVDEPPTCQSNAAVDFNEEWTGEVFNFMGMDPEGVAGRYGITNIDAVNFFGLSEEYRNAISVDENTGVLSIINPVDAEKEGTDYIVDVTVEYAVDTDIVACVVGLRLNDVEGKVVSGLRLNENQLPAQYIGDIDQDLNPDMWIPTTTDQDAGFRNASGYIVWGIGLNAYLQDTGLGDVNLSEMGSGVVHVSVNLPGTFTQGGHRLTAKLVKDIDADGLHEVLFGVVPTDDSQSDVIDASLPLAYLVSGIAFIENATLVLDNLPTGQGIEISALPSDAFTTSRRGLSIASGNFDGDNAGDIALSVPEFSPAGSNQGVLFVANDEVLLPAFTSGSLNLHQNNSVAAFSELSGNSFSGVGYSLAVIPDVDTDGIDELAIADDADEIGILMGSDIQSASTTNVTIYSTLNSSAGLNRYNMPGSNIQFNHQDFDLNNDGIADLLASTQFETKVIDGRDISGTIDIEPYALRSTDIPFRGVESLGDIDGDGLDDFVNDQWVVLGKNFAGLSAGATFFVDEMLAGDGLFLLPVNAGDTSQRSITAIPDVDGDSKSELVITKFSEDGTEPLPDNTLVVKSSDVDAALASGGSDLDLGDLFDDESTP